MIQRITFKIAGMHCAACAVNIEINLKRKKGVIKTSVNYPAKKAEIEYYDEQISINEIKEGIRETGYDIDEKNDNDRKKSEKLQLLTVLSTLILNLPLVIRMFWKWEIPGEIINISFSGWAQMLLAGVIVFAFGWRFHRNAFLAVKKMQADMDTLISLGTVAAFSYSTYSLFTGGHIYFDSAATIATLIILGKFLESKTASKANQAIQKLMEISSGQAMVLDKDGQEVEKNIDDIKVGDVLVVRAGEKVALDGIIIEGEGNFDESMLSGESLPVFKKKNALVFAGTISTDGLLKVRVEKTSGETFLAQIITAVEEAQNFKAPAQKLADRISSVFVPIVLALSISTFLGWFLTGHGLAISLTNAVAVLVISCPCALGLATPIAIMAGTGLAAKQGILIKNGASFEKGKNIDTVVFDKTGTLTKGEPSVKKVEVLSLTENETWKIAYSLSQNSLHPLSQAISRAALERGLTPDKPESFHEKSGRGIMGIWSGKKIALGNLALMSEENVDSDLALEKISPDKTSTKLFLSLEQSVIAVFFIGDQIRPEAAAAIIAANQAGLKTMMISGDSQTVAQAVAEQLGMDDYLAEVLPQEKQNEIKKMQAEGHKVAFVGDGLNDAPALAQADLGVAMAGGTDIAKEAGDIIIISNNPNKAILAIKLAKRVFFAIKGNLFWAFFYNVLAIPLAMAGLVNPMVAAAAMGLSDLTIIANSLWLYKYQENRK